MKYAALIVLLTLLACSEKIDTKSRLKIDTAVEENLKKRSLDFWISCRAAATEKASDTVDSILLLRAYTTGLDSADAPPRPIRPELTAPSLDPDSTPLKSILPVKKGG